MPTFLDELPGCYPVLFACLVMLAKQYDPSSPMTYRVYGWYKPSIHIVWFMALLDYASPTLHSSHLITHKVN